MLTHRNRIGWRHVMFQGCDSVGSNLSIQLGYVMACAWFALYFTAPWLTRGAVLCSSSGDTPDITRLYRPAGLQSQDTSGMDQHHAAVGLHTRIHESEICSIGFVLFFFDRQTLQFSNSMNKVLKDNCCHGSLNAP